MGKVYEETMYTRTCSLYAINLYSVTLIVKVKIKNQTYTELKSSHTRSQFTRNELSKVNHNHYIHSDFQSSICLLVED